MAMPMVEVRAAARADLKIIRFPGSIQLRLVGMGMNPDVRQIKTARGWTIEVNTGQSMAPLGSPKFFTMPDAGMDSIFMAREPWRLQVTVSGQQFGVTSHHGQWPRCGSEFQCSPCH